MSDQVDEFLQPVEPEIETTEDTTEQETGEETTQVAAETIEEQVVTPTAAEKALQAELARVRQKNREIESALLAKQEEEKPYLGEEYEQRFKETENKFEQRLINQKLDLSESFARDKYADFPEKLAVFEEMVKENPILYREMVSQSNPAEFAYKTAANQLKMKEMGNPVEYETKLRAEITAELEAKYKKQMESETRKRDELPGSLADARGAAGTKAQVWAGPTALGDILK